MPNDLLDQRDQLVADLNQRIRVTTTIDSDGSFNVFVGNGQPLVVGQRTFEMQALPAVDDLQQFDIALGGFGSTPVRLPESLINGGTLGGLLAFRGQSLDAAQDSLGRAAVVVAQTFNEQHKLGQDLLGNVGGDFFKAPASPSVQPSTANTGGATVTATLTNAADLQASDYRLSYDGANYNLLRLSDSTPVYSGALPASVDGFSLTVSTAPNAGDSFLIRPVRSGARDIAVALTDVRNIAAAIPVRTLVANTNSGTGVISPGRVIAPPPAHADLRHQVTITFNDPPVTYDVLDATSGASLATNVPYTTGADITYNGWTSQISGSPAAGDVFTVEANASGVSDNRNALLLGQLQTRLLVGGAASYQSAYSQLVSNIGNKARQVEVTLMAQENLVKQAQDAQQSLSGVNLDEEAANLLRYQQAYQAAGRVMEIAGRLFDEILALGR